MYSLRIFRYGDIDRRLENKIIEYIKNVFEKTSIYPSYLEIYLYEREIDLESHLYKDRIKFNSHQPMELYFAMHDAYYGWPRIHVCLEMIKKLNEDIWSGGVKHEAAHSILHGSLEYYMFRIPENLMRFCRYMRYNNDICISILHKISLIVKDYQVTDFLLKYGFGDEIYPFTLYNLELEDEIGIYRTLMKDYQKIILILTILKPVGASIPYLLVSRFRDEISNRIENIFKNFQPDYQLDINILLNLFDKMTGDFKNDLEYFSKKILKIFRK